MNHKVSSSTAAIYVDALLSTPVQSDDAKIMKTKCESFLKTLDEDAHLS